MPMPGFLDNIFHHSEHKALEDQAATTAALNDASKPLAERLHPVDHAHLNDTISLYAADVPSTSTPNQERSMSFKSVLADVGSKVKSFFTGAVKVAEAAEPFVDTMFPGIGPLFNTVVAGIGTAEVAATAAGAQNGSGPQKLAFVVQSVEQSFIAWATQNGYKIPDQAQITNAVNGAVAFVNSLSAEPAQQTLTVEQMTAKVNALAAAQNAANHV